MLPKSLRPRPRRAVPGEESLVLSPIVWRHLLVAPATCRRMANPKIGPSRMVRSAGNRILDLVHTRGLDPAATAADRLAGVSAESPAAAPRFVVSAACNWAK
jgi:hypothetical protein